MIEKVLGKITSAYYGLGGYQDVQLGLSVSLEGEGGGTSDFSGFWADKPGKHAKWTVEDQIKYHGEVALMIVELLHQAKVDRVEKLVGKPVEITWDNHMLKSWRILTEVL